jgi:hypothetical protein
MDATSDARPLPSTTRTAPTALVVASLASLGAGAIHVRAVGLHDEHASAAAAFALLAAFQIAWGVLALVQPRRFVVTLGALGNAVALGGWLATRTSGIGFIDGLEAAESPGFADGVAAALAAVAVLGAVAYLIAPSRLRLPMLAGPFPAAAVTGTLVVAAIMAANGDTHAHSDAHPVPYDGTLPVDLSGVPGVTPEQQAEAEALVTTNIEQLPRYADPAAAEAVGYRAIGDAVTGTEHLVNWSYLNDGHNLDASYPEALVYKVGRGGSRTLEAAMYVLEPPATLDTLPAIGGQLLQYHVHNDLCWAGQDGAYQVLPAAPLPAPCPAGTERRLLQPMVHVWIVGNPCGPFAALEGIGGGQVRPGEEVQCDHAHGVGAL